MSSVEVECAHTGTSSHAEPAAHVYSASTDSDGRWTSGGEPLGVHRWTTDRHTGARVVDQPGRGRLAFLRCPTCGRSLSRRGLKLGRDLDAVVAAGMDRVDLRVLVRNASRVR